MPAPVISFSNLRVVDNKALVDYSVSNTPLTACQAKIYHDSAVGLYLTVASAGTLSLPLDPGYSQITVDFTATNSSGTTNHVAQSSVNVVPSSVKSFPQVPVTRTVPVPPSTRTFPLPPGGWVYTLGSLVDASSAPVAPTNLVATQGTHATEIVLTWDVTPGATTYNVYYLVHGVPSILSTGLTSPTYADTTLGPSMSANYVVTAVNVSGESPDSSPVTGFTSTPTLVADVSVVGQVTFTFTGADITEPTNGIPTTFIAIKDQTNSFVCDTAAITAGTMVTSQAYGTYTFYMVSENDNGDLGTPQATAGPVTVIQPSITTAPNITINGHSNNSPSDSQISFMWDYPTNTNSFEYSTDNGVTWTGTSIASFGPLHGTPGAAGAFKVRAVNTVGAGPTGTKAFTFDIVPASLSIGLAAGSVQISWSFADIVTLVGGFTPNKVRITDDLGNHFDSTAAASGSLTILIPTQEAAGVRTWILTAYSTSASVSGPTQATQSGTAVGAAPTGTPVVTGTSTSNTDSTHSSIVWNWTSVANTSGYDVSTDSGVTWTANGAGTTVTTVGTPGSTQILDVRATNATGHGPTGTNFFNYAQVPAPTGTPTVSMVSTTNTDSTHSSINWTWTSVATATGYDYSLDNFATVLGSTSGTTITTIGTPSASVTLYVRATNAGGSGPTGSNTETYAAAPAYTMTLNNDVQSAWTNNLEVAWASLSGATDSYEITVDGVNTASILLANAAGGNTFITVSTGTPHTIAIHPVSGGVQGAAILSQSWTSASLVADVSVAGHVTFTWAHVDIVTGTPTGIQINNETGPPTAIYTGALTTSGTATVTSATGLQTWVIYTTSSPGVAASAGQARDDKTVT